MNKKSKIIYLHYGNDHKNPDEIFRKKNPDLYLCGGLGSYLNEVFEKAGYQTKITLDGKNLGDFAAFISWDITPALLKNMENYKREKCFLLVFEPPVVRTDYYDQKTKERFGKIFVLLENYVDNKTYFKIHHYPLHLLNSRISKEEEVPFAKKRFCCMVNGNKYFNNDPGELYLERGFLALFLMSKDEFDLYGWKYIAEEVPCWKGIAPKDKSATLKNYKFTLCYENTWNQPGYMTERIFDSFLARSIPIYLGAPDILDYVPEECFVNIKTLCNEKRGTSTYQHIYNYLKSIDEHKYNSTKSH